MFPKNYNNNTLSTHQPTQKLATRQILSVKTKSIWQTSLSKFNNHFWKVRVKWINYRVLPKRHFLQSPRLPWWGHVFLLKNFEWLRFSTDWALVSKNNCWRSPKMQYIVSQKLREKISWKLCTENPWTSLKILADLQLSLRSSGTIFTDRQGKRAHRSVQILKENSTWGILPWVPWSPRCSKNLVRSCQVSQYGSKRVPRKSLEFLGRNLRESFMNSLENIITLQNKHFYIFDYHFVLFLGHSIFASFDCLKLVLQKFTELSWVHRAVNFVQVDSINDADCANYETTSRRSIKDISLFI